MSTDTLSEAALKPCPLCGGKAELWRAHPENPKLNAWVACADRCLVLTQEFESNEAAIAHWNRRAATQAAPVAVVGDLVKAVLDDVVHALMVLPVPIDGQGKRAWASLLDAQKLLEAALSPTLAVPGDAVLVPREPTAEMLIAGHKAWDAITEDGLEATCAAYTAMLTAAPSAPLPTGNVGEAEPIAWADPHTIGAGSPYVNKTQTVAHTMPLFAAPPKPVADTGVVTAARDLLASLDPDALNPEQFNAWSALAAASQRSGE